LDSAAAVYVSIKMKTYTLEEIRSTYEWWWSLLDLSDAPRSWNIVVCMQDWYDLYMDEKTLPPSKEDLKRNIEKSIPTFLYELEKDYGDLENVRWRYDETNTMFVRIDGE